MSRFNSFPTHNLISRNRHANLLHVQSAPDCIIIVDILRRVFISRRSLQIIVKPLMQHHHCIRHVHHRNLQFVHTRHQIRIHHATSRHHRLKHVEVRAAVENPAVLSIKSPYFLYRTAALAETLPRSDSICVIPVLFERVGGHFELLDVESHRRHQELRFRNGEKGKLRL